MNFILLNDLFISEPPESLSLQPFVEKYLYLWNRKSMTEFVTWALNKPYGSLPGDVRDGDGEVMMEGIVDVGDIVLQAKEAEEVR